MPYPQMRLLLALLLFLTIGITTHNQIFAQQDIIPEWIRGVAGFWAEKKISDQEFIDAIEFLIEHGIIKVSSSEIEKEIKIKEQHPTPESQAKSITKDLFDPTDKKENQNSLTIKKIAAEWIRGEISDESYLKQHQDLINSGFIPSFPKSIRDHNANEPLPDWIKNNAGWYAENVISNYDYYQGLIYLYKNGYLSNPDTESQDPINNDELKEDTNSKTENKKSLDIKEKTKSIAKDWSDGNISDSEYFEQIQDLVDKGLIDPFNLHQSKKDQVTKEIVKKIPQTHTIQYSLDESEKTITIYHGDTVQWVNDDNEAHTVTSGVKEYRFDQKFFDRSLTPDSKTAHAFLSVGTFTFFCKYHEHDEKFTINVEAEYEQVVIPSWIKDNARWWSSGQISYDDYRGSLEEIFKLGLIDNPSSFTPNPPSEPKTPRQMIRDNALKWSNAKISDELYLDNVAKFISNHTLGPPTYGSHEEIHNKTIPTWIKDNAKQFGVGNSTIEEYTKALNYLWRMGLLHVSY